MTIQFIVDVGQQNFRTQLVLPGVFDQRIYTGTPWLYLIHNRGTKHKVWLKKVTGTNNYALYSREWKKFISDSCYVNVNTFHFIRVALDEYYVTGYEKNGFECNGYNMNQVGNRQKRCLVTLRTLEKSPVLPAGLFEDKLTQSLRVLVNERLVSTVAQRFVTISSNYPGYELYGQNWHVLAYVEHFEIGQRFVITNVLNRTIKMIPFGQSGLGLRSERVPRMRLNARTPFMICPTDNDPRMRHECVWADHDAEHNDEKKCFYSPLLAYVTDRSRLTIPSDFVDNNTLQQYHNAYLLHDELRFYVDLELVPHPENPGKKNHMTINTRWRNIVEDCGFRQNKMVRFKLTDTACDVYETVDPSYPVMILVFNMCYIGVSQLMLNMLYVVAVAERMYRSLI